MCGIISLINNEPQYNIRKTFSSLFNQMLWAGALRGFDSTGVALCNPRWRNDPLVKMYKRALCSPDFLSTKQYEKLSSSIQDYGYIIGHNRAATKGSVTDIFAHPFEFDNLIGVHNGTLSHHDKLTNIKYESDSEALYHALNEANNYCEVLEKLDGAYALVWYNKIDKKLYLAKNKERPLAMLTTKDNLSVLVSEFQMGQWLLDRNGIKQEEAWDVPDGKLIAISNDKPNEWEEVSDFTVYKKVYQIMDYKSDNNYQDSPRKELYKYRSDVEVKITDIIPQGKSSSRVEGYVVDALYPRAVAYITTYNNLHDKIVVGDIVTAKVASSYYKKDDPQLTVTLDSTTIKQVSQANDNDEGCGLDNDEFVIGPRGELINKEEWDKSDLSTCCVCGDPISFDDADQVEYSHNHDTVCPKCIDDYKNINGFIQ